MSEWREVNLGDIASVVSGHANITKSSYVQQGYVAYSAKGPDGFLPTYQHDEDGIIVSSVGSKAGKTWFARGKWSSIANTMIILSTEGMSDPRFIYYWTILRQQFPLRGSAQPFISREDARRVRISIPDIVEQRRIAGLLGAFDDLIEIDDSLIQWSQRIERASFLRWTKAQGEHVQVKEVAEHLPGRYLKKSQYGPTGRFPVFGSNSIMGRYDRYLYEGPLTVVARIGSNCGAVRFWLSPAWVNNNASAIKSLSPDFQFRVHQGLLSIDMTKHRAGSGQPFIRVDSLMNDEIPWPVPGMATWDKAASDLEVGVTGLQGEVDQLRRTRDALLPQLMSGAIRVSEVEDSVP